jgi:hypothetical protein
LATLARNLAYSRGRVLAREAEFRAPETDPEELPDPRHQDPGCSPGGWHRWATGLTEDQRQLVGLRHGAGLSLRQIGLVLGIPEQRVKSRLFTLRQRLRTLSAPGPGSVAPPLLEEKIMDQIQTLRLGAHVFERLSLAAQADFALAVLAGRPVADSLLTDLGLVDRGAEFLTLYGTTLGLKELIGILNHVDRFTECRLVEHLEVIAPPEAEKIKQNMFVFEDVVLFDQKAVRLLVETADQDLLAQALAGTERRVVNHVLGALEPGARSRLEARLAGVDTDRRLVRSAQELVVHGIKDLEQSGRLVLRRHGDVPDGEIYLTVP